MAAIFQAEENPVIFSVGSYNDSSYFQDQSDYIEDLIRVTLNRAGLQCERSDHTGEGSPVMGMPLGLMARCIIMAVSMIDQWRTRVEKDRVRANLPLVHVTLKARQSDMDLKSEKMLMEMKEAGISFTLIAMIPALQNYLSSVIPFINFSFRVEVILDNGTSVLLRTQGHEVSERNTSAMITKMKKRPLHSKAFTLHRNLLGFTVLKTEHSAPEPL